MAWYLHHLIDYCSELYESRLLPEIININRERVGAINPIKYNEVANFIQQYWEELKHDMSLRPIK